MSKNKLIKPVEWSKPLYENEYQRYMLYKDNAETMGRLGQLPIEVAKVTAAFYESKAKNCKLNEFGIIPN